MAKWNYNLKTYGIALRELIWKDDSSKENCNAILNQIINCCKYIQDKLTDEDKDLYEFDIEELIQDCDDTKYYLDEYNEESNEDNVNDILRNFYDLMDSMRVWIALYTQQND